MRGIDNVESNRRAEGTSELTAGLCHDGGEKR